MSWTDVKITPESINDFFTSIDIDALLHNIDLILNEEVENEKRQR